jgi:hypothetical protein
MRAETVIMKADGGINKRMNGGCEEGALMDWWQKKGSLLYLCAVIGLMACRCRPVPDKNKLYHFCLYIRGKKEVVKSFVLFLYFSIFSFLFLILIYVIEMYFILSISFCIF